MTAFEVCGRPYPGIPDTYRGTARETPLVNEAIGIDHEANRALMAAAESGEGRIASIEAARRIEQSQRGLGGDGRFEIVEVTLHGELPVVGRRHLGYDVSFEFGTESLLASLLPTPA